MPRCLILILFLVLFPVLVSSAQEPLPPVTVQQVIQEPTPATAVSAVPPAETVPKQLHRVLTLPELDQKRLLRLQDLAKEIKGQRLSMEDFDGYLNWMGGTLAGYSKYVEAGSFAAGFAKYLPVPYAGQAGQLTKFISHFALSLSSTSAALKSYLVSTQYFIAGVESIGPTPAGKEQELASLTFYADQKLSRDMTDLQEQLATTSELSGSALSFLLGLQQYLGNTDEYWHKTKSFLGKKDAEKAEKGALAGSIDGLRTRAQNFNTRLKQYDETVKTTMPRISSLVAFSELRQDMESGAGEQLSKNNNSNN